MPRGLSLPHFIAGRQAMADYPLKGVPLWEAVQLTIHFELLAGVEDSTRREMKECEMQS